MVDLNDTGILESSSPDVVGSVPILDAGKNTNDPGGIGAIHVVNLEFTLDAIDEFFVGEILGKDKGTGGDGAVDCGGHGAKLAADAYAGRTKRRIMVFVTGEEGMKNHFAFEDTKKVFNDEAILFREVRRRNEGKWRIGDILNLLSLLIV